MGSRPAAPVIPGAYAPAEGWLWDPWFFLEGETIHVFHLLQQGDRGVTGTSIRRDAPVIAHATWSPTDGWHREPLAIEPTGDWYDAARIHTGWVGEDRDGFAMLYSASNAHVALARSDDRDLRTWKKVAANPVASPDPDLYLNRWRDPWLLAEGTHEPFTMVVAAQQAGGDGQPVGVVAVAHASDLSAWRQDRPLLTPPWFEWLEVPELHHIGGTWVLLFATRAKWLTPAGRVAFAQLGLDPTDGAYCLTADSWRGPYDHLRFLSTTDPPGYTTRLVRPAPGVAWLWSHVEVGDDPFFLAPPRPTRLEDLVGGTKMGG